MYKDILRSIDSLGMWGALALVLFLMVFTYWAVSACFLDKDFQEKMSHLPLDDKEDLK